MPLGTEVGFGPGDFVFDEDPASPGKKGTAPTQFLAHFCCGQTAGWIKMPLGTEVNLGPGDVVLDGVTAPPYKGHNPQFLIHDYCDQTAGWMKTRLGTKVDLGPGQIVLEMGTQLPAKGGQQPPLLSPYYVYCGHGRPSQLLLSSCSRSYRQK